MSRPHDEPVVASEGRWMHIRSVCVYHRHFPEVRGEGRSIAEASEHLAGQLIRCLDHVRGPKRARIKKALAELRTRCPTATRPQRSAIAPPAVAAAHPAPTAAPAATSNPQPPSRPRSGRRKTPRPARVPGG